MFSHILLPDVAENQVADHPALNLTVFHRFARTVSRRLFEMQEERHFASSLETSKHKGCPKTCDVCEW